MMNAQVLVLNRSWVAVNVAPLRRALLLLFQGHARVVHPSDYSLYDFPSWCALSQFGDTLPDRHYVHTPSLRIRLPEVIVLTDFNDCVRPEVRLSRRNIFVRDRHVCQYCGRRFARAELTIDHVVPRSRGGRDTWTNLVLACMACNLKKRNRTPEEAGMPLLRRPAEPRWLPRFGTRIPPAELITWQSFVDLAYWNTDIGE